MHIGLVIGSPKIGGAERQVRTLARGLLDRGHPSRIYFLERAGRRAAGTVLDFTGLDCTHLGHGRGRGWWSRRRFRHLVETGGIDCLLAFNVDAMEFVVQSLTPPQSGRLLVGSVRGLGFDGNADRSRRLKLCASKMNAITCNSPAIRRSLVANGVCEAEDVSIIPNIVEFPSVAVAPQFETPGALFVGNLLEVKRPELFVGSVQAARRRGLPMRGIVVGAGPLATRTRHATGDDAPHFAFRGHLPPHEIPYADAVVAVSTSRREGESNVLLEAMAHGLPVVASCAGGNLDLIEESGAGVLVDSDRPEDYASAMVDILHDHDRWHELAAAGRRYIQQRHLVGSVIQELERLIFSLQGDRIRG